jgi:hypothetical protein
VTGRGTEARTAPAVAADQAAPASPADDFEDTEPADTVTFD